MDLTTSPSFFASHMQVLAVEEEGNNGFLKGRKDNPFVDPICKLNLKETSDFVKAFPMATTAHETGGVFKKEGITKRNHHHVLDAPPTPGRPVFSFSVGSASRKNFPSKWDDAEKWVINGTDSPAHLHHHHHGHGFLKSSSAAAADNTNGYNMKQMEKSRVTTEEKLSSKAISVYQGPTTITVDHHHHSAIALNGFSDVSVKDKFANEVVEQTFPKFKCLEPMKEGFFFGNSSDKSMKDAATEVVHHHHHHQEVQRRDIGTEMTPLGSSTTSRCPTPFKTLSPPRHNTPADRSGPLALTAMEGNAIDIAEFQECHFAKLKLGTTEFDPVASNWSSREEEEEDVSKSLRHFEMSNECRRSVSESRACAWEEEEKTKCCLRYQREEAKIQAWVNLQSAKAEAQSRKLEVKIQKMRSNLEEKLMKRMANVHRKAEELRATARFQHTEQIQRATEQAKKTMSMNVNRHHRSHFSGDYSCGCFPCNSLHH